MKTAYFGLGSGTGNLAVGASVFNGLRRAGISTDFTALTNCEFSTSFAGYFKTSFEVKKIKPEPEKLFTDDLDTELYKALYSVKPDLIIVYMMWMPIMPLLEEFSCPKILLIRECPPWWRSMQTGPDDRLDVNLQDYTAAFSIEPGFRPAGFDTLPPLVLKNREELPSREECRRRLGIGTEKKCCILAQNGSPGEFEKIKAEAEKGFAGGIDLTGYQLIQTTNRETAAYSLFPLIDYLPAADCIIGGAGYSLFYESRMLDIPGYFTSFQRNAENQQWRIDTNSSYKFERNGADVLAERIKSF